MHTIHIAGSIGGETVYQPEDIRALVDSPRHELAHGGDLTGRPHTRIHAENGHLVKIKEELQMNLVSSQRYVDQALRRESELAVHHPEKTWFYATSEDGTPPLIGNICPQLTPLNVLFNQTSGAHPETCLERIQQLFAMYFHAVITNQARLDEGLSNFGVDSAGKLYYLDDDVYGWDRFVACAQMLGVFLRSQPWITPELGTRLGGTLRELILREFDDTQYLTVLAEQVRGVFLPPAREPAMHALTDALYQERPVEARRQIANHRYIALLADIHSNLPALEAVLAELARHGVDHGMVLGDIVGYGPHPAQCIDRLRDTDFSLVKGNHDHGLATGKYQKGFSSTAQWALAWSEERISDEQRQWLLDLPPTLREDNWLALHGAPVDPTFFNAYVYAMTYEQNLDALEHRGIRYCFHGHTHIPGIYSRIPGRSDAHHWESRVETGNFFHGLLCPGSVGQPRNGLSGAHFAIFDRQEEVVTFHQVNYDPSGIIEEMQRAGFPAALVNMLRA